MKFHLFLLAAILAVSLPALSTAQDDDVDIMDEADFDNVDPALFEDDEAEGDSTVNVPKTQRPVYVAPVAKGKTFFADAFESEAAYRQNWVESKARKDDTDESIAKYDGVWSIEEPEDNALQGDLSLVLKSKAKHHATAAKLSSPFTFSGKPFIVQFEVKFQNGQDCGGAYVKLLSEAGNSDLKKFYDKSPYTIMFGPDKCGNDFKLHFIFRHKNPITGEYEEKHAKKPASPVDKFFDKKTHLYTLTINPDNSFEVMVDQGVVNSGSLLNDVSPPVNPPKEITDPEDKKPVDWDEREKIPDPDAEKPDDWDEDEPEKIADEEAEKPEGWLDDEPELIPDEDSERPDDWDDDMDGEWEPPMISNPACEDAAGCGEWTRPMIKNPKYKGKWRPPMIDNPDYKGKWSARLIPNPDFFEDNEPYKMTPIGAIGLELWSMSNDIAFDNFIITDDPEVARQYGQDSWELKHTQELTSSSSGSSVVDAVIDATNERPWLWAVFIIVVLLPIVLVVAYCCMPSSSPKAVGWFSSLYQSAMERKWLFGVYAVVVLLPFAILSVWLCPNSGPGIKQSDITAKKTDAPTADDEREEDDEDDVKEEAAGDAAKGAKGKAQLDAEPEEEAEDEGEEKSTPKTRTSPRKRKGKASTDS